MKYCFILVFSFLAFISKAQYPFEKYPAVHYKTYKGWKIGSKFHKDGSMDLLFTMTIPHFFDTENLKIVLITVDSPRGNHISLYKGKKLIQKSPEEMPFHTGDLTEFVRIADINGDSLLDIKMILPYNGCGLANMNVQIIYLFQNENGKFTKFSYMDKLESYMYTNKPGATDWENRPERDMDGDGNYEIITMYLQGVKEHNYWTFNLYNYKDGKLVNVNDKFDYPVMVQFLYRDNYKPANFSKAVRNKYSVKMPGIEPIDQLANIN